ncbi:MAG: DUF371 domain-containing protein [Candidatus Woesearchaeota archaeon]
MRQEKTKFIFNINGHKNVLSEHKSTLEFITSDSLTRRGDCILGVNADNTFSGVMALKGKCKITIRYGALVDSFSAYINPDFNTEDQMVIRRSRFLDERTAMILSNRASIDIDRRIVNALKNPQKNAEVTIEQVKVKNLVFDFDDTLEVWSENEAEADKVMAEHIVSYILQHDATSDISVHRLVKELEATKSRFIRRKRQPRYYGRGVWMKDALARLGNPVPAEVISEAEDKYWDMIQSLIKPYPGTLETLSKLKKKYNLFMLSDSDGHRELKMRRIRKLGLPSLFDGIYTSDDTGCNKPFPEAFKRFFRSAGIDPHESAFIGDHPEADHIGSKPFGMTTILLFQGPYAELGKKRGHGYVDFSIDSIRELPGLLKDLKEGMIRQHL